MTRIFLYDENKYDSKEIVDPKADLIIRNKKALDEYLKEIRPGSSKTFIYSLSSSIISKYSNDKDIVFVSPEEEYPDVFNTI